jgi:hypothetical protein
MIASLRWILRLPSRVLRGISSKLAFFSFDSEEQTDPELAHLWLMLLASDPEGTWHSWPRTVRRPSVDDTTHG